MNGINLISPKDIGTYEITLAKCGALRLIWFANPYGGNKYEVCAGDEKKIETNYLWAAMDVYNALVQ